MPHYVYRIYDAEGQLLYVGCTRNPARRLTDHQRTAVWADEIASVRNTVYPSRRVALHYEKKAIANERPLHNIVGAPGDIRSVTPPSAGIQSIRQALGLTQSEVCARVAAITGKGFTVGSLSAVERGHRGASAETLAALEVALRLLPGSLHVDYRPTHDRRKKGAAA